MVNYTTCHEKVMTRNLPIFKTLHYHLVLYEFHDLVINWNIIDKTIITLGLNPASQILRLKNWSKLDCIEHIYFSGHFFRFLSKSPTCRRHKKRIFWPKKEELWSFIFGPRLEQFWFFVLLNILSRIERKCNSKSSSKVRFKRSVEA